MESLKKTQTGVVVSNKMEKTVVVQVMRQVRHPLFKKYYTKRKKFMAHDENKECQLGDKVLIAECRPLSASKRWRVTQVIAKGVSHI